MGWEALIPIIAQYGLPLAEKLFEKWSSGASVTAADFVELRAAANQTALDRAKAVLVSKGISLDSDQAKVLLSMVSVS